MRSESPDEVRESAAIGRGIGVPVVCSFLLHGLVLGMLVHASFEPPADARIPEERPYLRVAMDLRTPVQAPESLIQDTEAVLESEIEEEQPDATATADDLVAELLQDTDPATELDEAATESGTAIRAWTSATIRAAVGAHVSNQHSTLIETWVTDCIIEQKQYGTRDCIRQHEAQDYLSANTRAGRAVVTTAYAGVTRRERYARLTEELEEEKRVMEELMEAPGLLGQMAADRYYLDREYVLFLNGNPSPYGPGNQFNCKGIGPCIYEYTGFVVERPETQVDENAFRVVSTVLGSQH